MKLPRDWSGEQLIQCLGKFGYLPTRQSGSHVRLTKELDTGSHHITIPLHNPLKLGTLNAIISDVASHLSISKTDVPQKCL